MLIAASTTFFACSDDDDNNDGNGQKPTGKYEISVGEYNKDAHTLKISWKAEQDAEYNWTIKEGDKTINTETTADGEVTEAGIHEFVLGNLTLEFDKEYTFELQDINGATLQTVKFTLTEEVDEPSGNDLKIKIESITKTDMGSMGDTWTVNVSWEAKKMMYDWKLIKSSDNSGLGQQQKNCETAGKVTLSVSPTKALTVGEKYKFQLFNMDGKLLSELEFTANVTE